ncbi:MAG TPA: beta-N-acetylglucosaminidase domain-containing protein [bacterium]|nr:beta-N-acetylglucosaminidase domain-containing protein [bacterium]
MKKSAAMFAVCALLLAASAARADLMGFNFLDIIPEPHISAMLGKPVPVSSFALSGAAPSADAPLDRALKDAFGKDFLEKTASGPGVLSISFAPASAFADADCAKLKCDRAILSSNIESYALKIEASGDGSALASIFSDHSRGRFYAVKTIKKLIAKYDGRRIDQTIIFDYPILEVRGVLEGYYGAPWAPADTLRTLDWMGDQKMNIFLYAPKDDPKNRSDWRSPYTEKELKRFQAFNDVSILNNIQFCWEISPGVSITYSSEQHFQDLIAKFHAVADIGVKCFVLAFDDTGKALSKEEDKARYKNIGEAQADITNRAYESIIKRVPDAKFSFVPVEYWNENVTEEYSGTVGDILHPDIIYGWTGNEICSWSVNKTDADFVAGYINRKPLLGDNVPVVDTFMAIKGPISLGPFQRRASDLHLSILGLTANAMPWMYSSWVNLAAIADYAWNPYAYDAQESWKKAIIDTVGLDAYSAFKPFAVLNQGTLINHHDSQDLRALIRKFWNNYHAGDLSPVKDEFKMEFQAIAGIQEPILKKVKNQFLLEELKSWLGKAAAYGEAGVIAIEVADKKLKGSLTKEEYDEFAAAVSRVENRKGEITRDALKSFFKELKEELKPENQP